MHQGGDALPVALDGGRGAPRPGPRQHERVAVEIDVPAAVGQPVADGQARVAEGAGESVPHAPRSPGGPELDHEVRHAAVHAQLARRGRDEQQGSARKTRLVGVEHRARVRRRDGEERGRRREDEGDDERGDRADHPPVGPVVRREGHERHDDRDRQPAVGVRHEQRVGVAHRDGGRRERRALARGRDHGVDERPAMEVHEVGRGGEVPREPGESGGGDEQPAPLGRALVDAPQATGEQDPARGQVRRRLIRPGVRDDLGRDAERDAGHGRARR